MFDDPGREFLYLRKVLDFTPTTGGLDLRVATVGREVLGVHVTFFAPEVVRVQFPAVGDRSERRSPMLVARPQRSRIHVHRGSRAIQLRSPALTVEIQRDPWRLQVQDANGHPVFVERADRDFDDFITYPTGIAVDRDTGARRAYVTFGLGHAEQFFGLGERYGPIGRRGLRTVLWSVDTHGTNSTDLVYKPVPFFMSTAGYGLFVHTTVRTTVDLGAYSTVSGWVSVEEPHLDVFLIHGSSLKDILARYLMLVGRVPLPAKWSFGIWMSRCMYRTRREVEQVVTQARRRQFPLDVVHLDPLWLQDRKSRDYDCSDLRWDERAFPRPAEFIRWLRRRGVRLSLWENPYFPMTSPRYAEAASRGYFLQDATGNPVRFRGLDAAIVDFTNPAARTWFKQLHQPLLRQGVAVFKTDYGEEVPEDAVAADGRTGAELHNVFPLLYNQTVFEATKTIVPQPVVWARSGWAGSQRYPVHWSGDAPSRWDALPWVLASGLSLALSGFAFWSHDIGGFFELRDPRLLVRWAQLGLLSSHARFHGREPREPWRYGGEAFAIIRRCAQLRYRLLPYLYSEAAAATRDGAPLMRPLALDYQDDPTTWTISDQYLLGRSLLIAPVLTERDERDIYLPAGTWWEFHGGRRWDGPRWLRLAVLLADIPIFVRDNTILPLGPAVQHSGQRADPLTFEVRLTDATAYTLRTDADTIVLAARAHGPAVSFRARGSVGRHIVRLVGAAADRVTVRGRGRLVSVRASPDATEITVQARGAYTLTATRR